MPHGDSYFTGDDYFTGEAWNATLEDMYRDINDDRSHSGGKFGHKTRRAVYSQFFQSVVPMGDSVPKDELHFMFGPKAIRRRDVKLLAARAAFWSTRSYLVTPYVLRREIYPDPYESPEEMYWLEVSDKFVALVIALKPYILHGCINVVPKHLPLSLQVVIPYILMLITQTSSACFFMKRLQGP